MRQLLFNHKDAWGVTLGITLVCLISHQAISISSLLLAGAITVAYWLGFAVNDYCDADFDRQDAKKAARNFFVEIRPRRRTLFAIIAVLLLAIIAILAPYGWRGAFSFCLSAFIVWSYSAPPLRLKKRPGVDLIVHAIFVQTYPYFLCLFLLQLTINALDTVLLPVFLLSSLAAQLEQQARDYEVDSKTEGNFTTHFGQHNTVRMASSVHSSAHCHLLRRCAQRRHTHLSHPARHDRVARPTASLYARSEPATLRTPSYGDHDTRLAVYRRDCLIDDVHLIKRDVFGMGSIGLEPMTSSTSTRRSSQLS